MKKMRKALALFLCLALCFGLMPAAYAADFDDEEIFVWDEEPWEEPWTEPEPVIEEPAPEPVIEEADPEPADEPEEEPLFVFEEDPDAEPEKPGETEKPEEEKDKPEDSEDQRVCVRFVCEPEDTKITVYDPNQLDEDGNPTVIEPEEDGTYLLLPGEYMYDAEAEGYCLVKNKVIYAVDTSTPQVVTVHMIFRGLEANTAAGAGPRKLEGGKRDFSWPVPTTNKISSCFLDGRDHYAIDIYADRRTDPVYAAYDGVVIEAYNSGTGFGNTVMIKHSYALSTGQVINLYTRYNHLSSISSEATASKNNGTIITRGTKVGNIGGTGGDYVNHLDFQILTSSDWKNYNYKNVSIDPFVNDLLEMPSGFNASGATTQCCYDYVTYVKELYNTPLTPSYLSQCTLYPTYGRIKITTACTPTTLPCNSETASRYGDTSTALTDKAQNVGDYANATGIVYNTENHYWYRVNLAGTIAYIYANRAEWVEYVAPWVDNNSFPSTITGSQALSGTITTGGGSTLKTVQGIVLKGNTTDASNQSNWTSVYSPEVSASGTTYALKGSAVDSGLAFQNLASGSYTLVYRVKVEQSKLNSSRKLVGPETNTYTIGAKHFTKTAGSCTLTLNANGGTVSPGSKTYTKGSTLGNLPTPTLTDTNLATKDLEFLYNFDGWYTAKTGGTRVDSNTVIDSDRTVYAHWVKSDFYSKISFDPQGGSFARVGGTEASSYTYHDYETGEDKSYSSYAAYLADNKYIYAASEGGYYHDLPVPTMSGYVFAGWGVRYHYGYGGWLDLSASWQPYSSAPCTVSTTCNGHVYELFEYNMSWTQAQAFCESRGGHLAVITDANEQAAVKGLFSMIPDSNGPANGLYYIGATKTGGTWKWVNGEAFIDSDSYWDSGEPSNGEGEYYSAIIGRKNPPNKEVGEWIDCPDTHFGDFYTIRNAGFICEYERPGIQAPVITAQPKNVTVVADNTATFTVTAEDADSYQWQYSTNKGKSWADSPATGNKTAALKVAAAAYKNGYQYRCLVTNSAGTVTSSAATLTVVAKPSITTQPRNQTAAAGTTATFTVTAAGNNLSYQWQYSTNNGKSWGKSPATGNTTATLKVYVTAAKNGYQYRCIVTNEAGTATSGAAVLTVLNPPVVTQQPKNVTAEVNASVSFTVKASNADSYQWQYSKDGGASWGSSPATGNKTDTLQLTATVSRDGYQYRCKITNGDGTVYSKAATLDVVAPPSFTQQPQSVTAKAGTTVYFTVTAKNADSYQWQYSSNNGKSWASSPAAGNKTARLTIPATSGRNGYRYRCVISNEIGSAESKAATLTVLSPTAWSTTKPSGVDSSLIETKTQYRSRDKETTTSTESSLSGWTADGTVQVWGDYGAWSSWSPTAVTASDARQVETAVIYRYYYFYCPTCGGHEPFTGKSDCGKYTLSSADWHEAWFTTPYSQCAHKTFSYTSAKYYTTSLGDGQSWCFSAGNLNNTAVGTKDSGGSDVVIKNGYRSRTRSQTTVYSFYRWTAWSSWGDTKLVGDDDTQVQTRTLYRWYK